MTKIAISPNASGTGTFTIAAPNSNTDRTFSLPDATGEVLTSAGGTVNGSFGVGSGASNRLALEYNTISGLATFGPNSTGGSTSLSVGTSNSGSFVSRLNIDSLGTMSMGSNVEVTTPAAEGLQLSPRLTAGPLYWGATSSTSAFVHFRFRNGNGTVGQIITSGSSTTYSTSSDYRLKENVVPLAGAADRLMQVPVYRFNFTADPDTIVDGFLAHELMDIVPECVTGLKDQVETVEVTDEDGNVTTETRPVYQGIDQSKLVPLLTAALQEALADIATLKAEVAALKGASA